MKKYFIYKVAFNFFSLFFVLLLTFTLMKKIPGSPFTEEQFCSQDVLKNLETAYHLDKSNTRQFIAYLKSACTFNFGCSLVYKEQTVRSVILKHFPVSARLGIQAIAFSLCLGIIFGVVSGTCRYQWSSYCISVWSNLSLTFPGFILGIILQYLFSVKISLFPIASWGSFSHTVLPTVTLACLPTAYITKLIKMSLLNIEHLDFMLFAKCKGLNQAKIIWRHALPHTVNPVLTYLTVLVPNILTGTFIVETIFGIPGLGRQFISSIWQRDYPIIMGLTLFYSIILIIITFFIDILIFFTNPELKRKIFNEKNS